MSKSSILLKGDIRVRIKQDSKAILVIGSGMNIIQRPGLKLIINQGVSGDNGSNGTDGVDGAYHTPAPTPVVDGTTFDVPSGKKIDSISVIPASGDRVLTVGYSAGQGEIIDSEDVLSDDGPSFFIGRYFHNGTTLHFSGFSGSVLIYLL